MLFSLFLQIVFATTIFAGTHKRKCHHRGNHPKGIPVRSSGNLNPLPDYDQGYVTPTPGGQNPLATPDISLGGLSPPGSGNPGYDQGYITPTPGGQNPLATPDISLGGLSPPGSGNPGYDQGYVTPTFGGQQPAATPDVPLGGLSPPGSGNPGYDQGYIPPTLSGQQPAATPDKSLGGLSPPGSGNTGYDQGYVVSTFSGQQPAATPDKSLGGLSPPGSSNPGYDQGYIAPTLSGESSFAISTGTVSGAPKATPYGLNPMPYAMPDPQSSYFSNLDPTSTQLPHVNLDGFYCRPGVFPCGPGGIPPIEISNQNNPSIYNSQLNGPLPNFAPGSFQSDNFKNLSFMIFGGWGNPNEPGQSLVAKTATELALKSNPRFVVSVGNNFYPTNTDNYEGVKSSTDSKWTSVWKNVYNGLLTSIPWFSVLGYHDWLGNPSAQLDYSKSHPAEWVMPNFFFERIFRIGKIEAAFIFIDTNYLAYGRNSPNEAITNNFKQIGWANKTDMVSMQLAWINDALKRHQGKKYTFVVGHHTLGTCDHQGNMTQLMDAFDEMQPTAYIFGNQQTLQATTRGKTKFIQVGASGKKEDACKGADGWSGGNTYGFANAMLTEDNYQFDMIDDSGKVLTSIKG
ncbi:hypothetical protein BATDEDRAFT_92878 [Batrachochytrium dendrobatidis JAM81]|uniref:Calcineurin-like phosphoesterase domain-containing protein n=1 Tax=Batrachochytrium dendrobatidis (strain JAM81 / FGSC 10211) TaxID=684364 RepID=F4PER8_BATDJ|nr:uncharacterized protein BATDEDRAFT_92878 [Batrachochytrium dendrobatidis JAM81]EGF76292.1 hypothetical protein BATDEDRAFT_92878 [Batrachochytrium dendrobatidis JAM81]|eukprot:XP_006683110.1 hypothetical protein BATDEDRAFT_92878 [Batrachochytrium dendrobatidis JAM81]